MEGDVFFDFMVRKNGNLSNDSKILCVTESILNNDIPKLEKRIKKYNISLKEINMNDKRSGFDALIFCIVNHVSDEMLNYIIDKGSYDDFNYLYIENDRTFRVPLFTAIEHNNFSLADRFIKHGANINYNIHCNMDTIPDSLSHIFPPLIGNYIFNNDHFKYYDEKVEGNLKHLRNMKDTMDIDGAESLIYHLIINGNIIHYLCEANGLNEQNLTYIVNNGFDTSRIKPSFIRRLKHHNKTEYIELISRICGVNFSDEELDLYDEDEILLNRAFLSTNLVKVAGISKEKNLENDPSLPYRLTKKALGFNDSNLNETQNKKKNNKKQNRQRKDRNKRRV
ncbi:hypothetical protein BCR32DRAFT_281672 [Anaeromyces robustus]|uniref:Ankyrin n=1 Tax=Anaeromyces robustus TaxID=1754192 RepID=A0A1Y1WZZ3_9FUNG|nr:hypothetical protein BCR32DRAFT_281672 [Anaeromyces robustus]|eukprot:ORX79120.1 hypothetical protein BCR32DRAFT_281672 [Anaeromyces robustus]